MDYIYPAVFHPNSDGSYTITFPDLEGCISEGKSLANTMYMAHSALKEWLEYLKDKGFDIPAASPVKSIITSGEDFATLIHIDLKENFAVRRTVSIPKWMDEKAINSGISLSRILQEALLKKFV